MTISIELSEAIKQISNIDNALIALSEQAAEQTKLAGVVSTDTLAAIEAQGVKQHELAERLLMLEQREPGPGQPGTIKTHGSQFVESDSYKSYQQGNSSKARFEIQANTLTGSDTNVAPDRKLGIVPGDTEILTLENIFPHVPTSSNAIEFTKEASFTDNTAEAAEAAEKAESALTWALVNMPVSNVAHWLKISRQLAADAPALAAYVNTRMIYGVNRRVETQIGAGDGIAPNISGILESGNFTAHGFADAALGTLKKVNLITKIVGSLWAAGGIPTAILLNPVDWAQIQVDLTDSVTAGARVDWAAGIGPRLNGLSVIQSNGITADIVAVGDFQAAGTIYDREAVVVELSDSDDDNFTKNLITIRAERRVALTIERPSMIIAGDLTPV